MISRSERKVEMAKATAETTVSTTVSSTALSRGGVALSAKEAVAQHLTNSPVEPGAEDEDDQMWNHAHMFGRRRRFSSITGMSPVEERMMFGSYGRPFPNSGYRAAADPRFGKPYTFAPEGMELRPGAAARVAFSQPSGVIAVGGGLMPVDAGS